MPFTVQELLGERPPPVVAKPEEAVDQALARMREHDFNQLPVVAEDGRPIGMLTNRSILRKLSFLELKLNALHVEDAMESRPATYAVDDDLFDLLDDLGNTYAVLIVNAEGKLTGILTSFDATEFFRNRYDAMMLVEDIESMLKELIRTAFTSSAGQVDEAALAKSIGENTGEWSRKRKLARSVMGRYLHATADGGGLKFDESKFQELFNQECPPDERKVLDKLTFNDFIQLLTGGETWKRLDDVLGAEPSTIRSLLTDVRDTRNDLAHFRGTPSPHDHERLKVCTEHLDRARTRLARRRMGPPSPAQEPPSPILQPTMGQIDPGAEVLRPSDSRYSRLAQHLQGQPQDMESLGLSFPQIEQIIGGQLPVSARSHRAWWSNDTRSHAQSKQWLDVGWRISTVSIEEGRVVFTRLPERAQLYSRFYNELLKDLREQATFSLRSSAGARVGWIWVADLPTGGPAAAHLGFSFALRDRFRVELYIDNGNAGDNKRLFDGLHAQREALETETGVALSWERLDDRRASRIAAYHRGSITDDANQLETLKKWAIDKMLRFYHALEPRVR